MGALKNTLKRKFARLAVFSGFLILLHVSLWMWFIIDSSTLVYMSGVYPNLSSTLPRSEIVNNITISSLPGVENKSHSLFVKILIIIHTMTIITPVLLWWSFDTLLGTIRKDLTFRTAYFFLLYDISLLVVYGFGLLLCNYSNVPYNPCNSFLYCRVNYNEQPAFCPSDVEPSNEILEPNYIYSRIYINIVLSIIVNIFNVALYAPLVEIKYLAYTILMKEDN